MTTGNTTLLKLALPVQGELSGTWGNVVNTSITELLDTAVAGATTISADSDITLTDTANAANQARQAILLWTATGTVTRTITAPARSKAYIVINATGGTQSIKLVGVGPTTGITVVAGERCLAAWNGADFVKVATSVPDGVTSVDVSGGTTGLTTSGGPVTSTGTITLAGILGVANGGTGATSLTLNNVLLGNGTSAPQAVAPGTTGNVLTSNGTTWSSTAPAYLPPRVNAQTTTASPWAWNSNNYDQQSFSALANALTINADAGSPVDGQRAVFRFKDDGTPRALTWTTGSSQSFRAVGITLPPTTTANKTTYVGCIYNANASRWDAVATVTEA